MTSTDLTSIVPFAPALLLTLLCAACAAGPIPSSTTMTDSCEAEVEDLHRFFEGWLSGALPQDQPTFARLERALDPEFEMVTPDGARVERAALVSSLYEAHGARGADLRLWVQHVHARALGDGLYLVRYEEWFEAGSEPRGRHSTAVMRDQGEAGLVWLHVQETWLPEGAP